MKLLYVVNPISGGESKDQFIANAETFCKKYGFLWKYFHTTGQDDIIKLKTEVEAYLPDRVVSIDGDGTTLMTLLALQGSTRY